MTEHRAAPGRLTHRTILTIAVPVMLSNASTPLIGLVDTGVVGQLSDPAYIGAVAVGSLIFTFVFWAFGFLRMGTTGLTAQALGAGDGTEVAACLGRALVIGAGIAAGLILLQWPIREMAFALLDASPGVEQLARGYFDIRIWAAPATLANYALLGWFVGLGRTDIGLVLQLVLNVTNIALDTLFVLGFGMAVRGVALGTVIAEFVAAAVGLVLALRYVRRFGAQLARGPRAGGRQAPPDARRQRRHHDPVVGAHCRVRLVRVPRRRARRRDSRGQRCVAEFHLRVRISSRRAVFRGRSPRRSGHRCGPSSRAHGGCAHDDALGRRRRSS